jgi:hypothetical protein
VSRTVWLGVDTMDFPEGGGHLWVYLNWALGLQALGCRVVWLEPYEPDVPADEVLERVRTLRERLEPYGLAESIAVCPKLDELPPEHDVEGCVPLEAAREADLLLNLAYYTHIALLPLFRRTALVDIDPGLTQMWIDEGVVKIPPYDTHFTIGETVGRADGSRSDRSLPWQYVPPCVALDWWPVCEAPDGAPFTTVSSWYSDLWFFDGAKWRPNNKRDGFLPYIDLPEHTSQPLELALALAPDEEDERATLEGRGWRVVLADDVGSTPRDYQRYIQNSRGEISCTKPSCTALQNAWVSDRTLCYLASGKPAVVEHTGPSRILPNAAGLLRFRSLAEAVGHLEAADADYERHSRLARALVEEHFDARKVVQSVLERALP